MSNILPPDLLAALGGGQPEGLPPEEGPEPPDEGGDTVSILQEMIELAKQYITVEQDQVDKHTMTKVLTTLQQYLADEQKEQDDALAGKVSPRLLRRQPGGAPA